MAIAGRKRMNRKNSARNSPIVPRNIPKSHRVGAYMPHDEGRKSRCRLVTIMTNRSSHMPTLTTSDRTKRSGTLVRARFIHKTCGTITLHVMSSQYVHQYGPVMRLNGTNISYLS